MSRTWHAALLLFIFAGLGAETVRAETAEQRAACSEDAQIHCGEFVPDRDQVHRCLLQKKRLLSPACRKVLDTPAAGQRR